MDVIEDSRSIALWIYYSYFCISGTLYSRHLSCRKRQTSLSCLQITNLQEKQQAEQQASWTEQGSPSWHAKREHMENLSAYGLPRRNTDASPGHTGMEIGRTEHGWIKNWQGVWRRKASIATLASRWTKKSDPIAERHQQPCDDIEKAEALFFADFLFTNLL